VLLIIQLIIDAYFDDHLVRFILKFTKLEVIILNIFRVIT